MQTWSKNPLHEAFLQKLLLEIHDKISELTVAFGDELDGVALAAEKIQKGQALMMQGDTELRRFVRVDAEHDIDLDQAIQALENELQASRTQLSSNKVSSNNVSEPKDLFSEIQVNFSEEHANEQHTKSPSADATYKVGEQSAEQVSRMVVDTDSSANQCATKVENVTEFCSERSSKHSYNLPWGATDSLEKCNSSSSVGTGQSGVTKTRSNQSKSFGRYIRNSFSRRSKEASDGTRIPSREKLSSFLSSNLVQIFSASLVFITVILICQDTDARARGTQPAEWQRLVMDFCFVMYVVEFGLTVFAQGPKKAASDYWNYLDAVVVLTSMFDYIMTWLDITRLQLLRLLRICRLLRIARIFRALKRLQRVPWLKEQYVLCMMIASCFRTLICACFICLGTTTLWAVLAVELLNDTVQELGTESFWNDCDRCSRSFSSVWEANWTFYQTIVAGDSWGLVALPVIEKAAWSSIIFLGSLFSIYFGVLQLVTAVVIDAFAERRANDIESMAYNLQSDEIREKRELQKMFEQIDEDKSGAVSRDELYKGAKDIPQFRSYLRVLDVDDKDLSELFDMVDYDASGEIDPEEFIDALYRLRNAETKTATKLVKHMVSVLVDKQRFMDEGLQEIRRELRQNYPWNNKQDDLEEKAQPPSNVLAMIENYLSKSADEVDNKAERVRTSKAPWPGRALGN